MNNLFLADPDCCDSHSDLKHLLAYFGARTGRYLVCYPSTWQKDIEARFAAAPELEQARLKTILRRARERLSLIEAPTANWSRSLSWRANADSYYETSQRIDRVVVAQAPERPYHLLADDLDELPLIAEERIDAIPSEFVRVGNILIRLSKELVFVDPYLNPCKTDIHVVLAALLPVIASGQCCSVKIYARYSEVVSSRNFSWEEVSSAWNELLKLMKPRRALAFNYYLLEDERTADKMHARYLFSVRGGLRIDNGFQRLPRGRKTDVAPLSEPVLDELITAFVDDADKLPVIKTWSFQIEGAT